ncbi:MAG: TIGR04283 family arsenosugar biosynthesis glycosyltransferase [Planctomycetaceae bacterium]|nr:TIGR04283 family arsenosugar biosynthesis glycosyltransferase [Planctomycetaceae bacterium]
MLAVNIGPVTPLDFVDSARHTRRHRDIFRIQEFRSGIFLSRSPQHVMQVSVIIPTLNESERIAAAIESCRLAGADEILVVDGGSTDATVSIAVESAQVVRSEAGRARQQNAGAQHACGDVLLFLHADCQLGRDAILHLRAALENDPQLVAGCFRQRLDQPGWQYRLLEWGNALRVRWLGWIYGDQGLFVRREVFLRLGGFPPIALMEDLAFSKQLSKTGRMALLSSRLIVSTRRWRQIGALRQTLRNWTFIALWHVGVSTDRLARWYRQIR